MGPLFCSSVRSMAKVDFFYFIANYNVLWPFKYMTFTVMARTIALVLLSVFFFSCGGKREKLEERGKKETIRVPVFNIDSAFHFTERQVAFGPRIPNTAAHRQTGEFLTSKFRSYGANVIIQNFVASTYDGQVLSLQNIVASYAPEKQKRILLAAHWDTRPYADKDLQHPGSKFDGANDGASGVAVLLEIARLLGENPDLQVGIDIILFDGEDWGERDDAAKQIPPPAGMNSWWCLGSQHWSRNKHKPGYSAYYGILLDMVGARESHFFQEGYSQEYAPKIVEKVWSTASRLGYSATFVRQKQAAITDDHVFVNEMAKIPMIDIVHFDPLLGYFGNYHHTQKDALPLIDKHTLGIVGNVLMNVIYHED